MAVSTALPLKFNPPKALNVKPPYLNVVGICIQVRIFFIRGFYNLNFALILQVISLPTATMPKRRILVVSEESDRGSGVKRRKIAVSLHPLKHLF